MTIDIETLRAEAKKLGIPQWHLKKEETLKAEIEAVKSGNVAVATEDAPRKKAPRIPIRRTDINERQRFLDDLNTRNPEYEHQFRPMNFPRDRIEAAGYEVVPGATLGDEIAVRTMKDSWLAWQEARNEGERNKMNAVDTEGSKILSLNASPKTGK